MDQRVKEMWVEALESGEYKQGKKRLNSVDGFCCLGVLCDLYAKDTGKGKWHSESGVVWQFQINGGDWYNAFPPLEVIEWAGLTDRYGDITTNGRINVAGMNDDGESFATIAKTIKEHA